RAADSDRLAEDGTDRNGRALQSAAPRFDPRARESLLDQVGEPAPFAHHQLAVLPHATFVPDDAVGEVLAGGPDRGERGAQLVGAAGDDLDLPPGEPPRAVGRDEERRDRQRQEQQDPEADGEVAGPALLDGRLERAAAVQRHEPPVPASDRRRAAGFHAAVRPPAPGRSPPRPPGPVPRARRPAAPRAEDLRAPPGAAAP